MNNAIMNAATIVTIASIIALGTMGEYYGALLAIVVLGVHTALLQVAVIEEESDHG